MTRSSLRATLGVAAVSALLLTALISSPVAAAGSVTVSVGCGGNAAASKLVAAVRDANARMPKTTILNLKAGCNYSFYRAHSFPVDGVRANALQVIRGNLVIHGHGALINRRTGAARFRFIAVDTQGNLSMDHVSIAGFAARNGQSGLAHLGDQGDDAKAGRDGGAIYNLGTVTLDHVGLDSNRAGSGGNGGAATGIDAGNGSGLNADHVSGGNAGAGGRGGAIYSEGSLTITNSTLTNNSAGNGGDGGAANGGDGGSAGAPNGKGGDGGSALGGNGGPGGYGGAIYSSGVLSIDNSLMTDNATGDGGDGGAATGGDGGAGMDDTGNGGAGGSANTLAASGGTGTAVYQWGGHFDVLNSVVNNNVGGNGGSSTSMGGNGGAGGCEGAGGSGGAAGAGSGNAGTDPLRADNGATLTSTGTTLSGNANGTGGGGSATGGVGGPGGGGCH